MNWNEHFLHLSLCFSLIFPFLTTSAHLHLGHDGFLFMGKGKQEIYNVIIYLKPSLLISISLIQKLIQIGRRPASFHGGANEDRRFSGDGKEWMKEGDFRHTISRGPCNVLHKPP